MKSKWKIFLFYLLLPVVLGGIVGFLSRSGSCYTGYTKPPLAPPGIVFPIVWTILYLLMGISSYLVATSHSWEKRRALNIYWAQLFLNYIWSFLFFTWNMKALALVDLILLIYFIIIMIRSFTKIIKSAGYLQIPYLLWCFFATYLNIAFLLLT